MDPALYSTAFEGGRPVASYVAVSTRVAVFKGLSEQVLSFYKERVLLEEGYIRSLAKLSGRLALPSTLDALTLESSELVQQLGAWQRVVDGLNQELAQLVVNHQEFTTSTKEAALTLRSALSTPQWASWTVQDTQLGSQIREYESSLDKLQKAQSKQSSKSSKANQTKMLTAQSQLSSLGSNISTALPQFINASQALEFKHCIVIKECLTRYGTILSDMGREEMEMGEKFLGTVLGVDEVVEMESFAVREGKRAGATGASAATPNGRAEPNGEFGEARTPRLNDTITQSTVRQAQPEAPRELELLSVPQVPDRVRTTSITRSAPPPVAPLLLPTNSISQPPTPVRTASSSSAQATTAGSGFKLSSFLGRDRAPSSSSKYGNLDAPTAASSSRDDRVSLESRNTTEPLEMDDSFTPSSSTNKPPASGNRKRDSIMPNFGGSLFRRGSKMVPPPPPPPRKSSIDPREEGNARPVPSRQATAERGEASAGESSAGVVDADGYSVKPQGYDKEPWQSSGATNLMDEDDDFDSSTMSTPKLASVSIIPSPILSTETSEERAAALERVKNTLLLSGATAGGVAALTLGAGSLARKQTASRGRRDARNTVINPVIPDDVPLAKIIEQTRAVEAKEAMPISSPSSPNATSFSGAPSPMFPPSPSRFESGRTNSMLSTTSGALSSSTRGPGVATRDPFEAAEGAGLRVSVVETVNVLIKGGQIQRAMITGEISMNLKPASAAGSTPLRLRIGKYDQYEKAAPNSSFLLPVADSPGEFVVNEAMVQKGFSTSTVLRYQLHILPGREAEFVPLNVRSQWKCEAGQSSIIIYYAINPASHLASTVSPFGEDDEAEQAMLQDLSFHIPLSSPITTFQSKPTATFSPDKSRLSFVVEPLPLSSTSPEAKLLARVNTEPTNTATAQPIAVRWNVTGRCFGAVAVEVVAGDVKIVETVKFSQAGKFLVA